MSEPINNWQVFNRPRKQGPGPNAGFHKSGTLALSAQAAALLSDQSSFSVDLLFDEGLRMVGIRANPNGAYTMRRVGLRNYTWQSNALDFCLYYNIERPLARRNVSKQEQMIVFSVDPDR